MENMWNNMKIPRYYDTPEGLVVTEERRAYEKAYREANKEKIKAYRESKKDILNELARKKRHKEKYPNGVKPLPKSVIYRNAKNKPCTDCGVILPPFAMDMDHCRGEKKFTPALYARAEITREVLVEELTKCDPVCVNCHRLRTSRRQPEPRHLKRRSIREAVEYLNELKKQPCTDCKQFFEPICMDFDHVRGEKKFNISQGKSYKKEVIMEELTKCELVCANCHRFRTQFTKRKKPN